MECAKNNWVTGQRSKACYEREITKLKNQNKALVEACEWGLRFILQADNSQPYRDKTITDLQAALAADKKE